MDSRWETADARTLVLDVPGWAGHRAGQHVDTKLTAANGYSAQRSYSIASVGAPDRLELTVQSVPGGEVSPYLVHTLAVGDELELRGPIGGWFRWTEDLPDPVLLVGGGSGVVPLMAMLRQRVRTGVDVPFHLLYSARTPEHVYYARELDQIERDVEGVRVQRVLTRSAAPDGSRAPGRLQHPDVPAVAQSPNHPARVYVCGPSAFVEHVTQLLLARGHAEHDIRTERFGPTGG
ncbi:ferredoxin reductase [Auraticoccus monumenti]|uniref:ferredoxin reductase n=1 Tax=Auraticoccus monumenti TaxID=675864 RepID=UPI00155F6085|nr:ferredoxin reductase [Auraticoccus monumenti]